MLKAALSNAFSTRSNTMPGSNTFLDSVFSFGSTNTGTISTDNALKISALYNGVNIISNDLSILPKDIFTRSGDNNTKYNAHPIYHSLAKRPNKAQSAYWFHKIMIVTAILRGNAIAVIRRNTETGQIDEDNALVFIHPDDLNDIKLIDGQLYFYTKYGVYTNDEVIHIKNFSTNGYTGISVLKHAAQNLNAALIAEDFAQTNFESKGFGLGIIKTAKTLTPDGKKALNEGMEARLSKGGKFNIGTLDEAMDFQPISVNAHEAELINWKKTTIEDVARWLNLSPHKLKQTDALNYNSIEQASLDHVSDSILPWVTQFEQEYNIKLFSKNESKNTYVKFNISALLRVDASSRAEYYNKMRFAGIYTGNEIRILEDKNPIDLPYMNEPLQPVQLQQQAQIKQNSDNGNKK